MWMSDARSRRAWVMSMVTTLATGESAPIVSCGRFRARAGGVDRGRRFDHPVYIGERPVGPIEGLASGTGRYHIQLNGAADGPPEFGFHSRSGVADDDFDDAVGFAERYRHVLPGHGLAQTAGELRVRGLPAEVSHFDPVLVGQNGSQLALVENALPDEQLAEA